MGRLAYPLGGRLTASASLLADEEHGVNAQNAKEEPEPEPRAAQEHPVRAAPTACIALRSAPRCAESAALRRARRSRASRKKKAATAPGRELIGAAISVHWEAEKCAPQPAHRTHGAGADSVAGLLRLLLALTARRAGNGTLEPCLSTTRAAGPTPSTTMMCVPRPALFCCVSLRTLRRWTG